MRWVCGCWGAGSGVGGFGGRSHLRVAVVVCMRVDGYFSCILYECRGLYACMLEGSCLLDYDAGKREEREKSLWRN